MSDVKLYLGDCLDVMRTLPESSVSSIVTDPPYGLSFMGKHWDHGVPGVAFWEAAYRVAKPGAMLLAFGGTRTFHRLTVAIEDAGWEIRDCLMWVYGSGFPKSHDISKAIDKAAGAEREVVGTRVSAYGTNTATGERVSRANGAGGAGLWGGNDAREVALTGAPATDAAKQWDGWGTNLKPAFEPIVLAMKPLDGTFAQNALKWGVAGLNVDVSRIPTTDSLGGGMVSMGRPKVSEGWDRPWMHDPQVTERKKVESAEKVKLAETQGRWPANVLFDEDAAALLDEMSGVSKSKASMRGLSGRHDAGDQSNQRIKPYTNSMRGHDDTGGASRFFYVAKASRSDRGEGNIHPCVKPEMLCRYLVRLVTPPNGTVLDPFMGSGSTGKAAKLEGFNFVGIELEPEYIEIARRRIEAAQPAQAERVQLPLLEAAG